MRRDTVRAGGRWVSALVTSTLVLGAGSCLVPNPGYCAFEHGDASCGEPRGMCVLAREDASHEGVENGCSAEVPEGFVRVRYGLPVLIEQPSLSSEDPRVVRGLLERLGYEGCGSIDELEAHFEPVIGGVAAVRRHLEERGRTRRAALDLTREHVAAIDAYDEAFAVWIDRCGAGTGTGSTMMVEETTTTAGSESESETSTTGSEPCMGDDECSGEAPFCNLEMGMCVACDGMPDPHIACAGMSAETPVCFEEVCVQCTVEMPEACTGSTSLCDVETNTCQPCTAHEQCGGAACNLFTGECLPADSVVHVGPGERYVTLAAALAAIDGPEGTIVVHANPLVYNESVTVNDGRVIAFLAAELGPGIEPPWWIRSSGNTPQLTVNTGGTALLDGMRLSSNASTTVPGLMVDGGRAWLDRSRIVLNDGDGVIAQANAELVLRNCFVGDGNLNDYSALDVSSASVYLVYSTLAAGFATATALRCDATSKVVARNSLFVARTDSPEILCGGATIDYSAAELDPGGTNTSLGPMSTTWFADNNGGDLHLTPAHPAVIDTTARWNLGDPPTDIDGEPRPTSDDTPDVAGADLP